MCLYTNFRDTTEAEQLNAKRRTSSEESCEEQLDTKPIAHEYMKVNSSLPRIITCKPYSTRNTNIDSSLFLKTIASSVSKSSVRSGPNFMTSPFSNKAGERISGDKNVMAEAPLRIADMEETKNSAM
jgi:hypothetical protein